MANVLGALFQDIANAIRGKTGSTDKMAPADFPAAIEAIEIDNGTYAEVKWVSNTGTFKTTSVNQSFVVEHGLGVVPDLVVVVSNVGASLDAGKDNWPDPAVYLAAALHRDMVEQITAGGYAYAHQYTFANSFETGFMYGGSSGVQMTSNNSKSFIKNANNISFEVGKDGMGLGVQKNIEYRWIAVGHK